MMRALLALPLFALAQLSLATPSLAQSTTPLAITTDVPPSADRIAAARPVIDKLWPLGSDVTFIPGHGAVSTFGQERRTNPFVADSVVG